MLRTLFIGMLEDDAQDNDDDGDDDYDDDEDGAGSATMSTTS